MSDTYLFVVPEYGIATSYGYNGGKVLFTNAFTGTIYYKEYLQLLFSDVGLDAEGYFVRNIKEEQKLFTFQPTLQKENLCKCGVCSFDHFNPVSISIIDIKSKVNNLVYSLNILMFSEESLKQLTTCIIVSPVRSTYRG